ncbi:MAG: hypothetical protein R3301_14555 [Saprospiraceae bacterium]|nr:hypothetical protein [Saprospiraceae bacterium]
MSTEIKKTLNIGTEFDKKSADFLSAAIAKHAQDGFDYIKYKQALNAMASMDLEEAIAFKSAFATAKTMGVTKTGLINSAKHYLQVLMNEKSQFDEALNNQVKERVASKKDQVLKYQSGIEEMRKKIEEMKKRIAEFQSKIDSADEEVEQAKAKIRQTKEKFESTFDAFVAIINEDIENAKEYL